MFWINSLKGFGLQKFVIKKNLLCRKPQWREIVRTCECYRQSFSLLFPFFESRIFEPLDRHWTSFSELKTCFRQVAVFDIGHHRIVEQFPDGKFLRQPRYSRNGSGWLSRHADPLGSDDELPQSRIPDPWHNTLIVVSCDIVGVIWLHAGYREPGFSKW